MLQISQEPKICNLVLKNYFDSYYFVNNSLDYTLYFSEIYLYVTTFGSASEGDQLSEKRSLITV